jgi:hypothetical protein
MKHKTKKELVVITIDITYSWFSVTKIFNIDYPNKDGDRTTYCFLLQHHGDNMSKLI